MNFLLLGALGRMNMILKCLTIGIVLGLLGNSTFVFHHLVLVLAKYCFRCACLLNIKGISILFQYATTVR
jgi:hypothetical protein